MSKSNIPAKYWILKWKRNRLTVSGKRPLLNDREEAALYTGLQHNGKNIGIGDLFSLSDRC